MMMLYTRQDGGVIAQPFEVGGVWPVGVIWADVEYGTLDEMAALQVALGVDLPNREEVWKNRTLNRMYAQDGVSFMTASVITKNDMHPQTSPVTFVLSEACLITLREIVPTSFKNFSSRLTGHARDFTSGPEVMEGLLEDVILRVAYNSELVVDELDELSHNIFNMDELEASTEHTTDRMKQLLRRLGSAADLNSKINESLHSFVRMLAFFKDDQADNTYLAHKIDTMIGDVKELLQQTAFLSDKITFQLDATLGMINVEQNMIMKILSVFTVVIMPPTLIGSIYGMNFQFMPELTHPWGYPLALSLMVVCAVGPYLYFRAKRWL